jgi:UDP-glucuronate 4-epimerase
MMARYLVTGGAGFIGSHLVQALLQRGDEVICLDNFDPYYPRAEKERNLREVGESPRLTLVEGDVCDPAAVDRLLSECRPETVLHLAAKAGVRPSLADPAGYMHVNACGTLNLLQSAVQHDVKRFVFTSSSSVYGGLTMVPFSEDQETMRPLSPYAASKLAAEMVCHAFHHLYKLPIVILRLFTVYGPRQRPDLAISKFSRLLDAEQPFPCWVTAKAAGTIPTSATPLVGYSLQQIPT